MEGALYGIIAEFAEPEQVLNAARGAYQAGYRKMEAYTPHEIEGLAEALGYHKTRVSLVALIGGICGALTAYGMEWFSAVIHFPLNVGGRPLHSWPSFIPITFELTVLFASLAAFFGMLAMNGLPKPYHPVFNAPDFKLATQTRYFLCIEAEDPRFKPEEVRGFLQSYSPISVVGVEV